MREAKDMTTQEIKNALWKMSCGSMPGGGAELDKDKLRKELYDRTGELLGYHEEAYRNEDKACDCARCERRAICQVADRFSRLPRKTEGGGLGLCPKLETEIEPKESAAQTDETPITRRITITYHMEKPGETAESCITLPLSDAWAETVIARDGRVLSIQRIVNELATLQGYVFAQVVCVKEKASSKP